MQTIAVIDHGSGNLRSVERALLAAAHRANRRREVRVTQSPDFVRHADRIVLPGVGAFADCMAGLNAIDGMREALTEAVKTRAAPFLGVCVGMQMLADEGQEFGVHPGLGWIHGQVRPLTTADQTLSIPHMGWNTTDARRSHPLLAGLHDAQPHFYFVHSFVFAVSDPADIVLTATHGEAFAAMVARENMAGVQFHPEKSQANGLDLLAGFMDWRP